jgi:hypothetical protein
MAADLRNILRRYDSKTMERHARECHLDNLREHGFPAERAREIATKAAEHQKQVIDPGAKRVEPLRANDARSRFRVRFDWEPEDAGIALSDPEPPKAA